MAKRAFPPSSYDERRVRERKKRERGGGRDPDESERRDGMEGAFFCFVSCSLVRFENMKLYTTSLYHHPKELQNSSM